MTETDLQDYSSQESGNTKELKGAGDACKERNWFDRGLRSIWSGLVNLLFFFYPGAVSKIHQEEAMEKYWILWRDVEILYNRKTDELGIDGSATLPQDPRDVNECIKENLKAIEKGYAVQKEKGKPEPESKTVKSDSEADEHKRKLLECKSHLKLLLYFYKILIKDRRKITRREGDLNILWRDITFIRTRMLTENIIAPHRLPFQLDYCRGEAVRLGVQDSEELQEIIIDAAVDLDNSDVNAGLDIGDSGHEYSGNNSPKPVNSRAINNRTVRNIVRLLTRLNNRRLKRLHEQRTNKLMYQAAFSILLLLSCILLHAHEHVLAPQIPPVECELEGKTGIDNKNGVQDKIGEKDAPSFDAVLPGNVVGSMNLSGESSTLFRVFPAKFFDFIEDVMETLFRGFVEPILDKCKSYMYENPLFFIFFAGLTGGFLSTVMKLGQGSNNSMPGDDAYYAWYALTKPFVGALAAAILYVIFRAGFVPTSVFSDTYITAIKSCPVGAKGFAFGCIMGFSERIIMPKVK